MLLLYCLTLRKIYEIFLNLTRFHVKSRNFKFEKLSFPCMFFIISIQKKGRREEGDVKHAKKEENQGDKKTNKPILFKKNKNLDFYVQTLQYTVHLALQ